jgi:hypothetical protein
VKTRLWVISILFVTIIIGCGERNSPLVPGGYYRLVGQTQTPGWAKDVCVLNDTAYVADNEGGIAVVDISDVTNPVYIGSWATVAPVKIIKVAPLNRLILTYQDVAGSATLDKVRMYSIDLHGVQVGEDFDTGITDIGLVEGTETIWIYATDSGDGFLGNFYRKYGPDAWFRENNIMPVLAPLGVMKGLDLNGTNTFIALDERGVWSLDLTVDPADSLSWIDTPGAAYDLVYQDGYLYVADYFNGLAIIDATNPDTLVMASEIRPSGASRCEKVVVQSTTAAVLDTYDGVYIIDVAVPTHPSVIDLIKLPEPTGLAFYGDKLLVTDEDQGLLIFQQ